MNVPAEQAKALFLEATERHAPDEWSAFLDRACAGDAELRAAVERLLRAREKLGSFHENARSLPEPMVDIGEAEFAGTVIGPYKLLERIGEGGMGLVFVAEQHEPVRRKVALKILKPGMDTRQVVARFEAERQALALMDHPNIARVFDGGATPSGRPYFAMELVKGVPITEFCDQNQLTPRQRLALFMQVCAAVQHAHQKGIIHRDLKPSNVLVSRHDTTAVVKVIDFGVAKALGQELTDKTLFTGIAQMIGTPLYMSPEQAGMSDLDVDTRSDIYSLGVLLYELLTGTTPFTREQFKQATFDQIRRIIREEEPPKPSKRLSESKVSLPSISAQRRTETVKLTRLIRGELDWIVMKALEKDRNRRYETAGAFSADVQRYLADEPVLACPPSAWYRFRKFTKRNRAALVTATAAALLIVSSVAVLATSNVLISRALKSETEAKDQLAENLTREWVDGYYRRIELAHAALSRDDLGSALKYLADCPEELRGWEWRYLVRLCRVDPLIIRAGSAVHGVAFSRDGKRLATAGANGAVRVWNSVTGKWIQECPDAHKGLVCCVVFHPHNDSHLASVGTDGRVKVWNLATDPPRVVFERECDAVHPVGTAYTAAFSPLEPDHLAVGYRGTVTIWNWRSEAPVHAFIGNETDRISLAFSPDGRRLAAGNWHGTVRLWDPVAGGGPLHTFTPAGGVRHPVAALSFDPDGTRLAVAKFDRRVDVWDTTTGQLVQSLPHPGGLVLGVAFSRDGLLASAGEDKVARVWDATGRELLALRGHAGMCGCVAFSSDGLRMASAGSDGSVRIWDATPLRGDERLESASFEEHRSEVWSVAVNTAGPGIVSAGWNMPAALVWDAATKRVSARFGGHSVVVFCAAWHPDGRRIATAGSADREFTLKIWHAATGAEDFTLRDPSRLEFLSVAFSRDGRHLVTGRGSGAVQVWDTGAGREVGILGTHRGPVRGVVFSPDRRHLATASADGEVKLWDATRLGEKQQPLCTFLAHSPGVGLTVAFSPDGKRLVMGDKGHTVKICDVETGRERLVLRGHNGDIHTVAVSPDGQWVASGGEDSTVKMWSARTGKPIRTFRGHTGLVSSLVFLDSQTLISGSRDHTVKLWDVSKLEADPGP